MDFSRRRLATYGKSNRRTVVHDLFNVTETEFAPFSASTPSSDASADVDANADPSHQLVQELNEAANSSSHVLKPRQKKPSKLSRGTKSGDDTQEVKRTKGPKHTNHTSETIRAGTPPSVFEIDSSSDNESHAKKRNNRLISSRAGTKPLHSTALPLTVEDNESVTSKQRMAGLKTVSSTKTKSIAMESEVGDSITFRPHISVSSSEPSPSQEEEEEEEEEPMMPASPKSDHSSASMASGKSTPKRKRQIDQDAASNNSSPSHLELSSLLLSPEKPFTQPQPWNRKQRPSDRLDSRAQSHLPLTTASHVPPRPKKSRKLLTSAEERDDLSYDQFHQTADTRAAEGRTDTVLTQPPARRTYGKQRSYLKDMVASESSQTSSQSSSLHELVSQVEALTAAKSGFEIEDESEDDDNDGEPTALKPKSIHELRHGGLASRFNMEIDTLFEDIDSGNKSLRIQALMSLVRKLQEKTFKAQLLASGKLGRLNKVGAPQLDLSSAMLILLALWALCVDETATCQALVQIYACLVHLPSAILTERRGLHDIAKDRKENLSKALIRDVADFEQHVINKSVPNGGSGSHSHRPTCIVVSRVSVQCLNYTLRRIILLEGKPQDAAPPVAFLRSAIACMRQHLADMSKSDEKAELVHVESIRLLLSWLERTAVTSAATDFREAEAGNKLVEELGGLLNDVMRWASRQQQWQQQAEKQQQPVEMEQSCIRTVVELSNRDVAVCHALAGSPLTSTLFAVVDEHFARLEGRLAENSDERQTELGEKLNSCILALGCLLNFAECSEEVRKKMAAEGQVDRLAKYFDLFVDQVDEAITEEMTQTLGVPFGYLCLLLCALCLNSSNRQHISSLIKGGRDGLNPLWHEAETCLHHMRLIDNNDGFTDRFNAMLDTVKSM